MEEMISMAVNNGVAVFVVVAFIFFLNTYMTKMNELLQDLSKTISDLVASVQALSHRFDDLETTIKEKKGEWRKWVQKNMKWLKKL